VPYLRAPFFVWLGRPWADSVKQAHHEQKIEAPALFPPTFLYTQSWEDPEPDMKVRWGLNPVYHCATCVKNEEELLGSEVSHSVLQGSCEELLPFICIMLICKKHGQVRVQLRRED
jgi:hypothetical protein